MPEMSRDRRVFEMSADATRILAIYLPQYYETADNNLWYGQGFTDWVAVKDAEAYFHGHQQPKVPLEYNYYDLTNKSVMQYQAELAKKYGIDGFCFYHYYFKNGKMELEVPAENLLKWKDIEMPFCFNWASSSWIRSWSRFGGNSWADKYDYLGTEATGDVLVEQKYGDFEDWKKHFEYLLPFFCDDRYIKVDGKPVFIFFNAESISSLEDMVSCWREEARKSGFDGLYLIGNTTSTVLPSMDAYMIYEPQNCLVRYRNRHDISIRNGVKCFQYDLMWNEIINTPVMCGKKTYLCALSGYDTTPRRGKDGEVLLETSPNVFQVGLTELLKRSIKRKNEFLFIDAWNEWGEGMYLEPDEDSGFQYLEAVKKSVDEALSGIEGYTDFGNVISLESQIHIAQKKTQRLQSLFSLLNKWCFCLEEGKISFQKYMNKRNCHDIAVYGIGAIGKHVIFRLKQEHINIKFVIDRYASFSNESFKVYRPESELPQVDLIVITAYDNGEIAKKLLEHGLNNSIYLAEMLDDMLSG